MTRHELFFNCPKCNEYMNLVSFSQFAPNSLIYDYHCGERFKVTATDDENHTITLRMTLTEDEKREDDSDVTDKVKSRKSRRLSSIIYYLSSLGR